MTRQPPGASASIWVLTFTSIPAIQPPTQKRLFMHCTDVSDAWEQARMRLGDTKCVVSIKPLNEILDEQDNT